MRTKGQSNRVSCACPLSTSALGGCLIACFFVSLLLGNCLLACFRYQANYSRSPRTRDLNNPSLKISVAQLACKQMDPLGALALAL
mmetsp:Transcript_6199/g.12597  ORF Transcript_6199/g.12597 Transcript_6199/m.12597 type:complete len:86 (-) Transcript_6199:451-708(-)